MALPSRIPLAGFRAVFVREVASYVATPLSGIFLVAFLVLSGVATFWPGAFLERGRADLEPFFAFHPWLYLVLAPAIAMRLWADERRSGTIEFLLTLPISLTQAVVAKFLAAWLMLAIALLGTLPLVVTVNHLGTPDNGVIAAGYLGSLALAGAYLAIGAAVSAASKSQVAAFIVAVSINLLLTVAGSPAVIAAVAGWAPGGVIDALVGFSFLARFESVTRGVLDLRDLVFVGSSILVFLYINVVLLDLRKAA